ncbi:hypothetical protein EDD85DRAFT_263661 [Armillaria nabsnona]|nr:hypothetical protein EDD85DRAFT_263661 [Armillaria nabsnona]
MISPDEEQSTMRGLWHHCICSSSTALIQTYLKVFLEYSWACQHRKIQLDLATRLRHMRMGHEHNGWLAVAKPSRDCSGDDGTWDAEQQGDPRRNDPPWKPVLGYDWPAITVANPDGLPDSVSTNILLCGSSRTASRWWVLLALLRVKNEAIQASKAAGSVGGMWRGARSRAYSHSGHWYGVSTFRRNSATIQASNAAGSDGGTSRRVLVARVVAVGCSLR